MRDTSIWPRRFESLAAADRCDDQVQLFVQRVAALFGQIFGGLLAGADLHELRVALLLMLAEMGAQTALAFVNLQHDSLLSSRPGERCNRQAMSYETRS